MSEQHALARLIESAKEANSWTNEDLRRRAESEGHSVSRSNISRILTHPVTTVVPSQVRMLADATGLPVRLVTLAALRSTGLSVYADDPDVVAALRSDPDLPDEVRRAVLAIVQPYKKRRRPQLHAVDSTDFNDSPLNPDVTPLPPTVWSDEHPEHERAARKRQPGTPPTRKRAVTDALEAAGEESQADEGGD